jgi:chaperone LolA
MLYLLLFTFFQNPVELIEDLQEKYDDNKAIQIEFTQRVSDGFDYTTEIAGNFSFMRPNYYRYTSEDGLMVTDMKTLWDYRSGLKQVRISDYNPKSQKVKPSDFFLNYKSNYNVIKLREEKNDIVVLKLFPKNSFSENSNMDVSKESILVWVNTEKLEIKRVEMSKKNGNLVTYVIKKTLFNPKLKAADFVFKAIKGVEEVDMRF